MRKQFHSLKTKYGIRILILMLSALFLCSFIARKEGYHMDEILAFELSNAEYNPWIVPTQPVGRLAKFMQEHINGESFTETLGNICFIVKDTLKNRGNSILAAYKADIYDAPVWISKESFQDYVQCDTDDAFNLFSVYFNVKDDNHPPLHFMLLHLMSSLFQGDITPWHGGVINLAAILGTLWLLGRIGDILFQKRSSTAALMILYGFSMGIVATVIWIRMYALLTLWTVWGLYLHLKKYTDKEHGFYDAKEGSRTRKWICSPAIFVVTLCSFWTQYFGLFFILPLALVTVLLLFRDKRLKEMWAYIRMMVLAAVIGVCVFPFSIADVLFSDRGTEAFSQWKNGLGEYRYRLSEFGSILARNTVGSVWILLLCTVVPLLLAVAVWSKKREDIGIVWEKLWLCGVPTLVYFLLAAKMSPFLVDRYIMAIFPLTLVVLVWIWDKACMVICGKKEYTAIVLFLSVLIVVFQAVEMKGQHPYLYTGYAQQLQLAEEYASYPLVCLYDGYEFYENVMEMERYEQTMLVKRSELQQMDEERTQVTKDGYVALIKYADAFSDSLKEIMDVFGGSEATLLYKSEAFSDEIYLIRP